MSNAEDLNLNGDVSCNNLCVRGEISCGVPMAGAPFALLVFDWQSGPIGTILSQTNIASVSRPVADNAANFVGVRDFTFTMPIVSVNRAVITANVQPPIFWPIPEPPGVRGPPVSAFPGLQCFGELLSVSVLRVYVYQTADLINIPNGLLSEAASRLWVHVAQVT